MPFQFFKKKSPEGDQTSSQSDSSKSDVTTSSLPPLDSWRSFRGAYPDIDEEVDITDVCGEVKEPARQITVLIVGAGMRGSIYASYARDFPSRMQVVGVAEPVQVRREKCQKIFNIPDDRVFTDWKQAAALDRFADAVVIATLDDLHRDPTIAFADLGYHILCEKPMSMTENECKEMVDAAERNNVILSVGHVMRYTPNIVKLKELVASGEIGEVMNIRHIEPVGWWHFAHSYVRGNWRKEVGDAGSLMAKSCHDIDIIKFLMGEKKCVKVQSFGSLSHFKKENMPEGAASRCLDCKVERSCPYSAIKSYLEPTSFEMPNYFCYAVSPDPDIENITEALRTGPYGRCVYDSDNDVCDNQVVNMQFEGGATASFTMCAFTELLCKRSISVYGTKGEIQLHEGQRDALTSFSFSTLRKTVYRKKRPREFSSLTGHGHADYYLMRKFVEAVAANDPSLIHSSAQDSFRGHRIVFAAERSRKMGGETLDVEI